MGILNASQPGAAQVGRDQRLFEAQEELARRTEELSTSRQINRELMARLNRERG